jgi:hypothetical protein
VKKSRFWTWVTVAAIVGAIVLGGVAACDLINRPLGPRLQVTPPAETPTMAATSTPLPTSTLVVASTPAVTPTAASAQADVAAQAETPTPSAGLCGHQGRATVLFLGESLPENYPERGASLIRLFQVDFDAGTVRVLTMPPYLYVSTPALAEAGLDSHVLTLTYWDALPQATGSERARMAHASNVLAQTLADNFGLVADNYFTVDQGSFIEMVDAWGGLQIDLPRDVDGSPSGFPYYYAGPQVMDGRATLDYLQIYPAAGDPSPIEWARTERQQQVIDASLAQLFRPASAIRLPVLVPRFYQDVVTDLSLRQVFALACILQAPGVSIEYLALEPDMVTEGANQILYPDMEKILAFLDTSFKQ